MIEAFLLTIFVFAMVLLMRNVSRAKPPDQQTGLGLFAYEDDSVPNKSTKPPERKTHA